MPQAKYVLVPKLLTPTIDPGETISVEVFLSGSGDVQENKFVFSYPTSIVDLAEPGEVVTSIASVTDTKTGKLIQPVSGRDFLRNFKCGPIGVTIGLKSRIFL